MITELLTHPATLGGGGSAVGLILWVLKNLKASKKDILVEVDRRLDAEVRVVEANDKIIMEKIDSVQRTLEGFSNKFNSIEERMWSYERAEKR